MKQFVRTRIFEPLKKQLAQGVTPGRLALALALGLVIGSTPILGITSLICAVVAAVFKLNQPAIQVANYVAYPLQIALFVPFFQAGARVFGIPQKDFSLTQLRTELATDLSGTISHYATANLRAVTVWAIVAPVAIALVFFVLRPLLARVRMPVTVDAAK